MGTTIFSCGCFITKCMFSHVVLRVGHCPEHSHLFSEDKTLKQMAREIYDLQDEIDARAKQEND